MTTAPLPSGKLPSRLLAELLAGVAPSPEVVIGPRPGEDAAVIELPAGDLVVAADPITLTGTGIGAHAVVVNANDIAVTGARPRWFLATVVLPVGTTEDGVRALFAEMTSALERIGAFLVGGYTEVSAAVTQPIVAGQMLGVVERGRAIASSGVVAGDVILQVGPVPVEGAAVLAVHDPTPAGVSNDLLEVSRRALAEPGISVVEPALLAARLGASAMHDPTEGGLATGLRELAEASGVGLDVDAGAVIWFEPGVAVCRALEADPWGTLASGALLAAFPAPRAGEALLEFRRRGYSAASVARATVAPAIAFADGRSLPRFDRDEIARLSNR